MIIFLPHSECASTSRFKQRADVETFLLSFHRNVSSLNSDFSLTFHPKRSFVWNNKITSSHSRTCCLVRCSMIIFQGARNQRSLERQTGRHCADHRTASVISDLTFSSSRSAAAAPYLNAGIKRNVPQKLASHSVGVAAEKPIWQHVSRTTGRLWDGRLGISWPHMRCNSGKKAHVTLYILVD